MLFEGVADEDDVFMASWTLVLVVLLGFDRRCVRRIARGVESVGITRIQPTPKSFRVDTSDVVTLQAVERWKNCADQDGSESSQARSGCVRQMHVLRARGGPVRGLRRGGRRGWCEEWARSG